jgi:hypothetical protein
MGGEGRFLGAREFGNIHSRRVSLESDGFLFNRCHSVERLRYYSCVDHALATSPSLRT